MFGADLPQPAPDRLVAYFLGPGFGESMVAAVPDGRVMVVDVCVHAGQNLAAALLAALKKTRVTLFAVTHPDLDHIAGLPEILTTFAPDHVATFPLSATFRDVVARRARELGGARLSALADATEALDAYQGKTGKVAETGYGRTTQLGAVAVMALAPTHYDQSRALRAWRTLVTGGAGGRKRLDEIVRGTVALSDVPNRSSMALSLTYGDARILLGGDVLRGRVSANSGARTRAGRAFSDSSRPTTSPRRLT